MPTLNWIGTEAVINHHRQVPYHLLRCDNSLSAGEADSGNLLVEGDNLLALKALLPYYAGQVKCIYIDPPYNTGNEKWKYNDNVNSPEIRKWLGKVVGAEGEDLTRNDKWLCMMYPRLCLLKEFLREDGAIFVSIDDAEVANMKYLLAEIFGQQNYIGTIIWQHSVQPKGYLGKFSIHHNYILAYQKTDEFVIGSLERKEEHNVSYSNPDNDPNGDWRSGDVRNALYRPNLIYDLETPSGKIIKPPAKGWRWSKETMSDKIQSGEIVFNTDETKITRKIYLRNQQGRAPESIWFAEDVGTTRKANQELKNIFAGEVPFETPKPLDLLERIIQLSVGKDDIVLDSFAGSGTTGHAVLSMNKQDGGNRRFILVEMDTDICNKITYNRLKSAIGGYTYNQNNIEGLGGGFRYCKLDKPLFDETGKIGETVKFADLAAHVFFTETGMPIPKRVNGASPFLGTANGTGYYLLFNGILGDKTPDGGNVLTGKVLAGLPKHNGQTVIFGEGCRLGEARLRREQIIFKQLPYEIKVS